MRWRWLWKRQERKRDVLQRTIEDEKQPKTARNRPLHLAPHQKKSFEALMALAGAAAKEMTSKQQFDAMEQVLEQRREDLIAPAAFEVVHAQIAELRKRGHNPAAQERMLRLIERARDESNDIAIMALAEEFILDDAAQEVVGNWPVVSSRTIPAPLLTALVAFTWADPAAVVAHHLEPLTLPEAPAALRHIAAAHRAIDLHRGENADRSENRYETMATLLDKLREQTLDAHAAAFSWRQVAAEANDDDTTLARAEAIDTLADAIKRNVGTLRQSVWTWIQAPDWDTSYRYLEDHPELLTEGSENELRQLLGAREARLNESGTRTLTNRLSLLSAARRGGIDLAYRRFTGKFAPASVAEYERALDQLDDVSATAQERQRLLDLVIAQTERTGDPTLWADSCANMALLLLRHRLGGDRRMELDEAVRLFADAAEVYSSDDLTASEWANAQNMLGSTLMLLANEYEGEIRNRYLQDALACYETSLKVRRLDTMPRGWAESQHNRATVLALRAETEQSEAQRASLQEALLSYDAALLVYREDATPQRWAASQQAKQEVLRTLASDGDPRLRGGRRRHQETITSSSESASNPPHKTREASYVMPESATPLELQQRGITLTLQAEAAEGNERKDLLLLALTCFDHGLSLVDSEQDLIQWAHLMINKADAYSELATTASGEDRIASLQQAIVFFDQAVGGEIGDRVHARDPMLWALGQSEKAACLRQTAPLLGTGAKEVALLEALACCNAALEERPREKVPSNWSHTQQVRGAILADLAASKRGDEQRAMLEDAIQTLAAALPYLSRDADRLEFATTQNNIANLQRKLSSHRTGEERLAGLRGAITSFDAALSAVTREEHPVPWAWFHNNKGLALAELGWAGSYEDAQATLNAALNSYEQALSVFTRQHMPTEHRAVAIEAGKLCLRAGAWQRVIPYFTTALATINDLFTLGVIARTQQSELQGGAPLAAILAYACVRACDPPARSDPIPPEAKEALKRLGLDENTTHVVVLGGDIVPQKYRAEMVHAVRVLDQTRARASGYAFRRHRAQLDAAQTLAPDLLGAFRSASAQLIHLYLRQTSIPMPSAEFTSQAPASASDNQLGGAATLMRAPSGDYAKSLTIRQTYDAVLEQIRERIPGFLDDDHDDPLRDACIELEPDERLVYVAATQLGGVAFAVAADSVSGYPEAVTGWWDTHLSFPGAVSNALETLLSASYPDDYLGNNNMRLLFQTQAATGRDPLLLAVLLATGTLGGRSTVLAQLASYCRTQQVKRIIVVPCGVLGLLPLHAIEVPTPPDYRFGQITPEETIATSWPDAPLIDSVQITYAPSARVWAECRRRGSLDASGRPVRALIVSNPLPLPPELAPLPGAEEETRWVRRLLSDTAQAHVDSLDGIAAQRKPVLAALTSAAPEVTHLHFACHGIADLRNPDLTGIVLAYGARLTVASLFQEALDVQFPNLRLVTLSACQTALPGGLLPDEFVGLPTGWLLAGASNVAATLWPIPDATVTVAYMTKLYELLARDRLNPADAVWLSQRWLRKLPTWRDDCRRLGAMYGALGPDADAFMEMQALIILGNKTPGNDDEQLALNVHAAAFALYGA